ncbi:MAG: tyrosine-type recombinase/integrase [Patescibacteria group bacterium]
MFTLKQLITEFLEHLKFEKGLNQLTIRNYDFYLKSFLAWAKIKQPKEIDLDLVRQYKLWLAKQQNRRGGNFSAATQNYYLIALRSFLRYLAKRGVKTLTPEKIELAKISKEISFLRGDNLEKFLNMPLQVDQQEIIKFRDKAILELLFSTGLRISELTNLKRQDINLTEDKFSIKGKDGKWRTVFLSNRARYWLKRYLEKRIDFDSSLFIRHDRGQKEVDQKEPKNKLSPRSIQRLIKKYVKIAGLTEKITTHSLRHSFAVNLLAAGVNLQTIQKLLGHKNITTTQIYTRIANQDLKKIYQAFHDKIKKSH